IYKYTKYEYCDFELFDAFVVDFLGWEEATFRLANADINRILRDFLRQNGVYVKMDKSLIAAKLAELNNLDNMPEWDPIELR
ncbi:uncharacterized protein BDR25DRAFT_163724, partial [Lindgomyces ingoldianus]